MTDSENGNTLAEVRSRVREVCDLLRRPSPAALDRCSVILEAALTSFRGLEPPPPRAEALELRTLLHRTATLLGSAAEYHAGWRRARGVLSGGYTGSGAPAAEPRSGRLCLQG